MPSSNRAGRHAAVVTALLWAALALFQAPGSPLAASAESTMREGAEPITLYLTWQRDPTTTMTIHWHTEGPGVTEVAYRRTGDSDWSRSKGGSNPMPFSSRMIHTVELEDLQPETLYHFRIAENDREYSFRTMPASLHRPIRIAVGGDLRHRQDWMEETNRQVLRFDVDFIAVGGDLAYADGREDRAYRWYEWFDAYRNTLIDRTGRVIPILAGVGNHEVRQGYHWRHDDFDHSPEARAEIAPYYLSLFAFPGDPGYGVMDFGNYLSVILLDTDHLNPIDGPQIKWLEKTLADRRHVPHVFPVYHVTGFPSHRSFDGRTESRVREHFVPLFEKYDLRLVFEKHDHTYKRTHPIRDGQVDPAGTVYMGDGAWGVGTRSVHPPESTWYLKRAESVRHFILVTIYPDQRHALAVDQEGYVFDELYQSLGGN